jgi:hypothetical protein
MKARAEIPVAEVWKFLRGEKVITINLPEGATELELQLQPDKKRLGIFSTMDQLFSYTNGLFKKFDDLLS